MVGGTLAAALARPRSSWRPRDHAVGRILTATSVAEWSQWTRFTDAYSGSSSTYALVDNLRRLVRRPV